MRKRFTLVVVVGIAITAGCLALYVRGPEFIEAISCKAYDVVLRYAQEPPKSGRVVIVDLDDRSLQEFGQWPWPRLLVARLSQKILDAGASVVAFDIVFAEPDRASPQVIRDDLRKQLGAEVSFIGLPPGLEDYDAYLASILKQGRFILGCAMRPCRTMVPDPDAAVDPFYDGSRFVLKGPPGVDVNESLSQASGLTVSIPALRQAAATAFFNTAVDWDNIVRRTPLIWAFGPRRIYPSLALEAVRLDRGVAQCLVKYNEQGIEYLRLKDLVIPCTKPGELVVHYRSVRRDALSGFSASFPIFSAADVMNGKTGPEAFTNRIVFVGTSAAGLRDIKATPVTEFFSGVEVQATIVDNMLAGDMLSLPSYMDGVQALAIVVAGLVLTVLIAGGRSWLAFLLSLGMAGAAVGASVALLRISQFVFVPTWVLLCVGVTYPVLATLRFWQEERQRRRVRHMFGTMVSTDVLRYLEKNPHTFSLTGEKRDATMLFSDVASFTAISEQLEPDRLAELLNRYLTAMAETITKRGGYIDKFEGDAVMAEWGVPFPMKDHAVQACLAAIEQQEKLAELRPLLKADFGYDVHIRIGINTGRVTAGNMGSETRFSYTVLGDAVNLAARLEPANKDYGTRILIGDGTFQQVRDAVETRLVDRLVVKGKSAFVQVYELVGRKGAITPERRQAVTLYEEALQLHWNRKWDEALARLQEANALVPDDAAGPSLAARIIAYQQQPPPADWTGEHYRQEKD